MSESVESSGEVVGRFAPGDLVAGKYEVIRELGRGGMGVVLLAKHLFLGQKVAIKILLPRESVDERRGAKAAARFMREARAAASLESEHVVKIHDVEILESGEPYYVMEFLEGADLASVLDQLRQVPPDEACEYVAQAALAMREAHAAGIVHRDLKPSNLFLTHRPSGAPLVKVLDFGISKGAAALLPESSGELTETSTALGSPLFMSPEQVRDASSVDYRSDIWSLGVILHQLITGKPPFDGNTLPSICAAISVDKPAPVREACPEAPAEVEAIIYKCLEKDPDDRYQGTALLLDALEPHRRSSSRVGSETLERTLESEKSVDDSDQPLAEPAGTAQPTRDEPVSGRPSRVAATPTRRSALVVAIVALTLALAAFFLSLRRPDPQPREAVVSVDTAEPSFPKTFALTIDSTPGGAAVRESGELLGITPLRIVVENAPLAGKQRRFAIEVEGYEPYQLEQSASASDVRIRAALVPLPSATPSAAPASESSATTIRSRKPKPTPPRPKPRTPPTTAPPASPVSTLEIRTTR